MRERKRLSKMTQADLEDKLRDLRSRRGQASKDAKETRRHLYRAEQRVLGEMNRRRKLRVEIKKR